MQAAKQKTRDGGGCGFDGKGGGRPGEVAGKDVREHRADSGGQRAVCGAEHNAGKQHKAVAEMDVAHGGRADFDYHCCDTGHGCKEGGRDRFFNCLISHGFLRFRRRRRLFVVFFSVRLRITQNGLIKISSYNKNDQTSCRGRRSL